ncbi:type IIL restriction-modification enzyme MmeI, partial [Sphingomonas sp. GC_Shp_2]|uniref:type IIL restriction-modification enzyme MmeI n=1 Tax=unclassified Sphingomonas TaxID=196159 RepID=UPI003211EA6B
DRFPTVYQWVIDRVKPERDENRDRDIKARWWQFGRTRPELREFTAGLRRYVVSAETSKHRLFQFLDTNILPDNKLVGIGLESADRLAVLSSSAHLIWALATGGLLEDRPVYVKTLCFDTFPFPFPLTPFPRLAELGERLDAFRKERVAAHDFLTMTGLYNALERVRELDAGIGEPLTPAEHGTYDAGQIAILKELHDEIDREVLAAYGWSDLGDRLVGKPGSTTPSPHKSADQEAAEEELLVRLVALNQARVAEERAGTVLWLRPDFQRPRLAAKEKGETQIEADLGDAVSVEAAKWPSDGLDQIRSVRDLLARADGPIAILALAAAFAGRNTPKRRQRVEQVLKTLVATGAARHDEATNGYYLPR